MKINPGIRLTVLLLQSQGFTSIDSGDKYVNMTCIPEALSLECKRLNSLLLMMGIKTEAMTENNDVPTIQGYYDPYTSLATISLYNVDDKLLKL